RRRARAAAAAAATLAGAAYAGDSCQPHWDNAIGQPGFESQVITFEVYDSGSGPELYAGGQFSQPVRRWSEETWLWVGSFYQFNGLVFALEGADGDEAGDLGPALYAGGNFTSFESRIAKWNGTSWKDL